jgi:hypothetical protein
MLGCLKSQYEDKSNRSTVRLACFLLVCRLKSVDWCSARFPRRGDFLPVTEEAMSITTIIFVLIILLFGFDSAEQVKSRRKTQSRLAIAREMFQVLRS